MVLPSAFVWAIGDKAMAATSQGLAQESVPLSVSR